MATGIGLGSSHEERLREAVLFRVDQRSPLAANHDVSDDVVGDQPATCLPTKSGPPFAINESRYVFTSARTGWISSRPASSESANRGHTLVTFEGTGVQLHAP
jgi:hypothetical protein